MYPHSDSCCRKRMCVKGLGRYALELARNLDDLPTKGL
ncbi:hypothetical protein SAMN04490199_4519 [Pseudomonas marginalis]|nr:hypothetical protein SAMN04490199_4519 [Pseudomonas marginalis]